MTILLFFEKEKRLDSKKRKNMFTLKLLKKYHYMLPVAWSYIHVSIARTVDFFNLNLLNSTEGSRLIFVLFFVLIFSACLLLLKRLISRMRKPNFMGRKFNFLFST